MVKLDPARDCAASLRYSLHVFLLFSLQKVLLCLELSTQVSNLAVYS